MHADRASVVSSFTIIKGALIDETYTVFREWDFARTPEDNLNEMREVNSVGAKSASWLLDVYKVLHRRFAPNGRDRPLVELAQSGCPIDTWKPVLLWHMTRDEFLLRDFLVNWLYRHFVDGTFRICTQDLFPYLRDLPGRGVVAEPWSESTLKRVASELLKIAVDFGLMRGAMMREFASYHLPDDAFLYLLHAMREQKRNPRKVIGAADWHMFLMDAGDVERELFRLHQFRKVHYEVAGSLAELELPCPSAAEYARRMVA